MREIPKQIAILSSILLLIGCAIGKQGVYLDEMPAKPAITIYSDTLNVKTQNSFRNSALSIYKIKVSVDETQKKIFLSADQALKKAYKEEFTIKLSKYNVIHPKNYEFYWRDPDNKIYKLDELINWKK